MKKIKSSTLICLGLSAALLAQTSFAEELCPSITDLKDASKWSAPYITKSGWHSNYPQSHLESHQIQFSSATFQIREGQHAGSCIYLFDGEDSLFLDKTAVEQPIKYKGKWKIGDEQGDLICMGNKLLPNACPFG